MKVNKTSGSSGAWLKKEDIRSGEKLMISSEASLVEGQNGAQLVAKVRRKGSNDLFNTAINNTSKNALIDAFGDDTADWNGKVVTAITEKAVIAGKRSLILYLIPEGYELKEGSDGFMTIEREAIQIQSRKREPEYEPADEDTREAPLPDEEMINPEDVPW